MAFVGAPTEFLYIINENSEALVQIVSTCSDFIIDNVKIKNYTPEKGVDSGSSDVSLNPFLKRDFYCNKVFKN